MENTPISAVIITYNEENNIARCINSVKKVADEIIVVDSFSQDNTKSIAQSLGVQFFEHKFEGHIQQKNYAIQKATHTYILSLDADEALSEELTENLIALKKTTLKNAYAINRITSYCGKWIKHGGWYPDRKVRLWNKKLGNWQGENPHDKVVMQEESEIGKIKKDILHYSFPTISSHAETANKFSEIAAMEGFKKGKKSYFLWHILLNPTFTFFKKYCFELGFLDGYYGFIISILSAHSNFLKYSKLRELNKKNGKTDHNL